MSANSSSTVVSSQREAARQLGISHTALQKAQRSGRVTEEPGGGWDPVKLRTQLIATADPARPRPEPLAAALPLSEASDPKVELANGPERDRMAPALPRPGSGGGTFQDARTANEVLKAQERRLRLDERRGKLVDKGRALLLVHRFAREERDAMLAWPARIAAVVAAELGVDPHHLQMLLDGQMREHLTERSRSRIEIT